MVRLVVAQVNEVHGLDFGVGRRLPGGYQSGAYQLFSRSHGRAVLKITTDSAWVPRVLAAEPLVERARRAGWPTPAWLAVGVTPQGWAYCVQDWVDGSAIGGLDEVGVDAVVELVEGQAGLAPPTGVDWQAYNRRVVFDGDGAVADRVAASGPAGAQIVGRFQALCAQHPDLITGPVDLVHGDLSTANLLVRAGRIVAVVDVEALGKGHRVSDYACLLREGYMDGADRHLLRRLRAVAEAGAGPGALAISCAATAFLVAGFVLEHLPRRWPDKCTGLLDLVADLGG